MTAGVCVYRVYSSYGQPCLKVLSNEVTKQGSKFVNL